MAKKKAEQKTTQIWDTSRAGHNRYVDRFQKFLEGKITNSKVKVLDMAPKDYIKLVEKWRGQKFIPSSRVQNILEHKLEQGNCNWAIPVLDLTINAYVGMNRAIAVNASGEKKMPVLVIALADKDIKALEGKKLKSDD